jgi:hypothetical protein
MLVTVVTAMITTAGVINSNKLENDRQQAKTASSGNN